MVGASALQFGGHGLGRLRSKGLITRLPRTNTYVRPRRTPITIFCTKRHNRSLRPLLTEFHTLAIKRREGALRAFKAFKFRIFECTESTRPLSLSTGQ